YEDVLIPTMVEIGDRWQAGTLSISEEHVASALVHRLIGRLGSQFARRGVKRGAIIIGAPVGDFHSLPTALVADLLRGRGFEVIDLGANTPGESFARVATSTGRLVAIGLAVSAPLDRSDPRGTIADIRSAELGVPIVVGGGQVSSAAEGEALGADFASTDADEFLAIIDDLADQSPSAAVG
ncbi:MAG: hypothetical protein HKN26_03145, partial [Acidimicrobiales bacterium]|nr:hypothetical protein [Acidimicrobiales bacterium]